MKLEALEDMHEFARGTARCFRRDAVGYFEAGRPKRPRSLAGWILQWALAERGGSARARDCCDVCARIQTVEAGLQWAKEVLGREHAPETARGQLR